jgi:diguanylate cyclase (GGDEF)-like protein
MEEVSQYDVQQVCMNGHQITDSFLCLPEFRKNYCDKCGEPTIHQCPNCNEPIKGHYNVPGVISINSAQVPAHCHNCGHPYPWTERKALEKKSETITDDELELAILKQYVEQHKKAETANVQDKCARELDMREVLKNITEDSGDSLEYNTRLWLDRLAPPVLGSSKGSFPLCRCSNSGLNQRAHKYHARAYKDSYHKPPAPAWDRIRELEARVHKPTFILPKKELEQKFKILLSEPQEQKDFKVWMKKASEFGYKIAVLFIDIDKFKELNNRYTETKVDQTILPDFQHFLKRLTHQRGEAYRHGGEEFVVILPNHDKDEALRFAEKLLTTFENTIFNVDGNEEKLTVSIGIAMWPDHGNKYSDVLEAANKAEHLAKEKGGNNVRTADTLFNNGK